MEKFLYIKNVKRDIVPSQNEDDHKKAKVILKKLYKDHKKELPSRFIENWEIVKLYSPSGDILKANAILIDPKDGAYSLDNKFNDLTGKQWTKFSCSWFIFNALSKDLKEEREISGDSKDHPATFSPTMIEQFINFFTKEKAKVFDPFLGIGSTTVACLRTNRIGYGTELNKKYFKIAVKRTPEFKDNIFNCDARNVKKLKLPKIDFSISSPPYWDILNRSTNKFKKSREDKKLDVNYSDSSIDLGNINDYDLFIDELSKIYFDLYSIMKPGGYVIVIIKNIKKSGKFYPLAWDLAKKLSEKYILKDEKIWIQDKIGLAPYGYPYDWVSNILHHYCLILKKPNGSK
ncbi:MAG: DNA methyltransferase [Bacteroidales bacterium]|jgi:DNA modification methylase|nr:DNA methyltransferase [Bacteroidales bacterium]